MSDPVRTAAQALVDRWYAGGGVVYAALEALRFALAHPVAAAVELSDAASHGLWGIGRDARCVISGTSDIKLTIDGNWEDETERLRFAGWLQVTLNASLAASDSAEPEPPKSTESPPASIEGLMKLVDEYGAAEYDDGNWSEEWSDIILEDAAAKVEAARTAVESYARAMLSGHQV